MREEYALSKVKRKIKEYLSIVIQGGREKQSGGEDGEKTRRPRGRPHKYSLLVGGGNTTLDFPLNT